MNRNRKYALPAALFKTFTLDNVNNEISQYNHFTKIAEILACSLANCHCQQEDSRITEFLMCLS